MRTENRIPGAQANCSVAQPRLSGFARRYFTLYHSGVLSYAIEPNQPARDHILLPQAAISTALGRKDIHIDSANATFHIKCLSEEEFTSWMTAFRYENPLLMV